MCVERSGVEGRLLGGGVTAVCEPSGRPVGHWDSASGARQSRCRWGAVCQFVNKREAVGEVAECITVVVRVAVGVTLACDPNNSGVCAPTRASVSGAVPSAGLIRARPPACAPPRPRSSAR